MHTVRYSWEWVDRDKQAIAALEKFRGSKSEALKELTAIKGMHMHGKIN